jgi:hypothetical protein
MSSSHNLAGTFVVVFDARQCQADALLLIETPSNYYGIKCSLAHDNIDSLVAQSPKTLVIECLARFVCVRTLRAAAFNSTVLTGRPQTLRPYPASHSQVSTHMDTIHIRTLAHFRSLVPVLCLQDLSACKRDEGRNLASFPQLINFAYTCRQSCGQRIVVPCQAFSVNSRFLRTY